MKAIRVSDYGGPEVLRLQAIETPQPGPGQARVRLAAAGLNFVDIYMRSGSYTAPLPVTAGLEGAVAGGHLQNFIRTREELPWRAGEVIAGIRDGWLKLRIDRVLPLAEAAEAHRLLEGRQSTGKLLLRIGQ